MSEAGGGPTWAWADKQVGWREDSGARRHMDPEQRASCGPCLLIPPSPMCVSHLYRGQIWTLS